MRHKLDAMLEVDRLVVEHGNFGLSQLSARKAALVTLQYDSGRDESLKQRSINYLRYILYGEEKALWFHEIEQQIRRDQNLLVNSWDWFESLSKSERDIINDSGKSPYQWLHNQINIRLEKIKLESQTFL